MTTKTQSAIDEALSAIADKAELEEKRQRKVTAELLNKAVLLDVSLHRWTNRVKADTLPKSGSRKTDEKARKRLSTTMRLVDSKAYDEIMTRTNKMREWIVTHCMPSFLVNGIFFVKLVAVEEFERELKDFNAWLDDEGIPALRRDWERAKGQAKEDFADIADSLGIDNPYKSVAYPDPDSLRERFGATWSWVSFGVPDSLPKAIREQEQAKISGRLNDAAEKIEQAALDGFNKLMEEATAKLVWKPGEAKPIIKEAFVENFKEFCETFRFRNLTDNSELEAAVKQAEVIMSNVTATTLRERGSVRKQTAAKLAEVKAVIDQMIVSTPRRKIDLDVLED